MSDSNGVPNAMWKDLMVMAQTAAGDEHEAPQQMKPGDRQFLESAMSDLAKKTDPVRCMKTLIEELKSLQDPTQLDIESLQSTVDALENIVCQIDAAVDFCTLGGLAEILRLMSCECDEIRVEVMRLIPTMAQHNPRVQDVMLDNEMIAVLMSMLVSTEESSDVKVKALSGLSSLVRAHEHAYTRFRQLNGFVVLMDAFKFAHHAQDEKVANKTAIVFANLAHDLGYQGALDHGLPACIIRMYGELVPSADAASYLREYIDQNISLKGIDSESRTVIENALKLQLAHKKERNSEDQDAISNIEAMISKLSPTS